MSAEKDNKTIAEGLATVHEALKGTNADTAEVKTLVEKVEKEIGDVHEKQQKEAQLVAEKFNAQQAELDIFKEKYEAQYKKSNRKGYGSGDLSDEDVLYSKYSGEMDSYIRKGVEPNSETIKEIAEHFVEKNIATKNEVELTRHKSLVSGANPDGGFLVFPDRRTDLRVERIFETSLDRFNDKSGELQEIVVHEDDFIVVMERKTFDLSDEDNNFQFVPDMHLLNHVQMLKDDADAAERRIYRGLQEKDQALLDAEHFKREAKTAKESSKTNLELLNRLTRESSRLQERIGNLEAVNQKLRAANHEYESTMDELLANASEKGTIKGMTTDDMLVHAIEKKKEIQEAMYDLEPEAESGEPPHSQDELDQLKGRLLQLEGKLAGVEKGAPQV